MIIHLNKYIQMNENMSTNSDKHRCVISSFLQKRQIEDTCCWKREALKSQRGARDESWRNISLLTHRHPCLSKKTELPYFSTSFSNGDWPMLLWWPSCRQCCWLLSAIQPPTSGCQIFSTRQSRWTWRWCWRRRTCWSARRPSLPRHPTSSGWRPGLSLPS